MWCVVERACKKMGPAKRSLRNVKFMEGFWIGASFTHLFVLIFQGVGIHHISIISSSSVDNNILFMGTLWSDSCRIDGG